MNRFRESLILCLAVILSMSFVYLSMTGVPVEADIFTYDSTDLVGIVTSNPNISMPEANVFVDVVVTSEWDYDLEINCSYVVRSNNTCNVTIAFVYPFYYSYVTDEGPILGEYNISIDNNPIYHETKTWNEMPSEIQDAFIWYNDELTFEIFNVTLNENVTSVIQVIGGFECSAYANSFSFDYMVETARWWAGNTREIVVMDVDVLTTIHSLKFYPESFLTITVNGTKHIGKWNFTIDEFPTYTSPRFEIWHYYTNPFPTSTTPTTTSVTSNSTTMSSFNTTTSSMTTTTTIIYSVTTSTIPTTSDDVNHVFTAGLIGMSVVILIVAVVYLLRKR